MANPPPSVLSPSQRGLPGKSGQTTPGEETGEIQVEGGWKLADLRSGERPQVTVGSRLRKFFNDWMSGSGGGRQVPAQPQGDIPIMLGRIDSWPGLVRNMRQNWTLHRLVMGTGGQGNLLTTEPRRNLLVLGPPRSEKTAGVLIPAILSHPGPVVATSTKGDILRATGLVRARLGRVWHYGPDASPTPPGCVELRWSPIPPARNWASAVALGKVMADVAETGGSGDNASYFRNKAAVLISALLHAAALEDKPMLWMLRAVAGHPATLQEGSEILNGSFSEDARIAAYDLDGILSLDERSKGSIFATTANAFAAYRLPGALRSTENPNFDPAGFVAGDPRAYNPHVVETVYPGQEIDQVTALARSNFMMGTYDTVYLTSSSEQQALVAPLVAGLLQQIREATFMRHRLDEENNYFSRPAVLWALDELAGIAPMRDLPETLSQAGGQGLLIAACLQDLQMARAKWDKAADGFLTLFGHVVIHPGIRDEATLRAVSTVIGQHWVTVGSSSTSSNIGGQGGPQRGWQESESQQLVARLEPGTIAQGRVNEHPHYVLVLTPSGWGWAFCTPYYAAPPWPQLIVSSMEHALFCGDAFERRWELPIPILDKDRSGRFLGWAGGQTLIDRFYYSARGLQTFGENRKSTLERVRTNELLAGYDDSKSSRLPSSVRSFIALRTDPGREALDAVIMQAGGRVGSGEEVLVPLDLGDSMVLPDLPGAVRPDWLLNVEGQSSYLSLVGGGVASKLAARNDVIERWQAEIPGAAVIIEAWSFSAPGLHSVRRLAHVLAERCPGSGVCWLSLNDVDHVDSWRPQLMGPSSASA